MFIINGYDRKAIACSPGLLVLKEDHVSIEEEKLSEIVVIVEEEKDGIENLEDLPRLVFIDKKWWIPY